MVRMKRRSTIVSLAFLMLMGIAVYFRLWAIDYNISIDDSEILRFLPSSSSLNSHKWRIIYFLHECYLPGQNCLRQFLIAVGRMIITHTTIVGRCGCEDYNISNIAVAVTDCNLKPFSIFYYKL